MIIRIGGWEPTPEQDAMRACEQSDVAAMMAALSKSKNPGELARKLLGKAARRGLLPCVESLAAIPGIDARWLDEDGASPLMAAAKADRLDILQVLLPMSDPAMLSQRGLTALFIALREGSPRCARALFPVSDPQARIPRVEGMAGADAGLDALMIAASGFDEECLAMAMEHGDPMRRADDGSSALMRAAKNANALGVELLLPLSDPRARDARGATALMMAADEGGLECARMLMPASDVDARDEKGLSALMRACVRGGPKLIGELARASDPSARDDKGDTALIRAILLHCGRLIDAVEQLLPVSDVEARNKEGVSALEAAARRGEGEVVGALLAALDKQRARRAGPLARAVERLVWRVSDRLERQSADRLERQSADGSWTDRDRVDKAARKALALIDPVLGIRNHARANPAMSAIIERRALAVIASQNKQRAPTPEPRKPRL